jgi:antitoxin (DNA-binding transcriptional repressor) of toxin-antitoxin stability system
MEIEEYSVEHWQENWDELIQRVEGGEHIGIVNEHGARAVMIPAEDDMIRLYKELNNDAP